MVNIPEGVEVIVSNEKICGCRFVVEQVERFENKTEISGVNFFGDEVICYVSNELSWDATENSYVGADDVVELLI